MQASGSAALEVALKAMGVGPGVEVIVPPYTFIATASAPLLIGATPVFCDIDLDTFNLSASRLEQAITPRTKVIVPVHFAGLAADLCESYIWAARRRDNAVYLTRKLAEIPGICPLATPPYATCHAFHIYVFRFDAPKFGVDRQNFLKALAGEGIPNSPGYAFPLYRNPMFRNPALGVSGEAYSALCANAERAC
jgi:Predicted pyridoxal phosphate-dependent enzyme apparently involved in regulation of cell wall biogenesis